VTARCSLNPQFFFGMVADDGASAESNATHAFFLTRVCFVASGPWDRDRAKNTREERANHSLLEASALNHSGCSASAGPRRGDSPVVIRVTMNTVGKSLGDCTLLSIGMNGNTGVWDPLSVKSFRTPSAIPWMLFMKIPPSETQPDGFDSQPVQDEVETNVVIFTFSIMARTIQIDRNDFWIRSCNFKSDDHRPQRSSFMSFVRDRPTGVHKIAVRAEMQDVPQNLARHHRANISREKEWAQ
jgi:hypothetical protein